MFELTKLSVPVAVLFSVLIGCAPENESLAPVPVIEQAPLSISDVSLRNTNLRVPLAALMTLTTSEPAVVELRIDDGERRALAS